MQVKRTSLALSIQLTLCLCAAAAAQQPSQPSKTMPFGYPAGRLESMKLLSPEIGWAATRSHLFWTTNAGGEWKDVTPRPAADGEVISAVFFLDSSTGWVLFAGGGNDDQARFDVASTADSGDHWTLSRVKISGFRPPEATLTGDGYMYFLDSIHGWINLTIASGSAFHPGAALATQDGGKTWNLVPMGSGSSGPILFTTPKDGWILSPDHTELDVTHDGSKSWQEVKLQAPPLAHPGVGEAYGYDLPTFEDAGHGFLMASFADSDRLVLFTTKDGGLTWKADRMLPHTEESEITIAHSSWIAASIPLHSRSLTITTISLRNIASQQAAVRADISRIVGTHALGGNAEHLDFADDTHGWVLAGELLATSDGGTNWSDITPLGARPAVRTEGPPPQSALPLGTLGISGPRSRVAAGAPAAKPGASPGVQTALGFDIGQVLCAPYPNCSTQQSITYMQDWGSSSPYLVTSLYLPSKNHTTDHYLTAAWVTAIQQQGWGLIPIWVGLQPPCACKGPGTYPKCMLFSYLIGPDATMAAKQGTADATTAEGVAAGLASGVAVIYKDLENYNPASVLPSGATCGSVVDAYLGSWDTKLHNDFYAAGVYGNPIPAVDWQSHVSPLPDDGWIAQYPANGKPAVTIWNVGTAYGMTDSMWPSYQRIHQYTNTHNEAWGGTPPFGIDADIVNAEIVSNNSATNYTYVYSNIDCTNLGATVTAPVAINDMHNGALINGPGQTGTIVGYYADANGDHGFQNSAGVCSSIDVAGAVVTEATGINNLGQIVGWWFDGVTYHGFLKNPGATPTTVNYPGATGTQFLGVNDAGQILGTAAISGTPEPQAFLYYGSGFYPIGNTTSNVLVATGINGDATVAGNTPYNFEDSLLPPSWAGSAVSINSPGGLVSATNSNNEVVGYNYLSSACGGYCGFLWTDNVILTLLNASNTDETYTYAINDFGQIVGEYLDSSVWHGGLWAPQ